MYDSIQIATFDTLNRLSISGKLFSSSGSDVFKDYWFPLLTIVITAILGFSLGYLADIWRNRRESRRQCGQKAQEAFLAVNEIDRLFATQVTATMMLPQYAASPDLARISDSIQNIESILNTFGWSLPNAITALFRKYTALAFTQKQTASEFMHFSDSLQRIIQTPTPNLDKRQEDLRNTFDNRHTELRNIITAIEVELHKLAR